MASAVGNLIKHLRQISGRTQHALGKSTHIAASRISNIESGIVYPTPTEIAAIATYFDNIELIQTYWVESPIYQATLRICGRMGIQVTEDTNLTIRQFAEDMRDRIQRICELCETLNQSEATRHEKIMLMGKEAKMISNLAEAFRLLVCDKKGGI